MNNACELLRKSMNIKKEIPPRMSSIHEKLEKAKLGIPGAC